MHVDVIYVDGCVGLCRGKMGDPRLANRHLVYYCDDDPYIRANTAFLLGAFLILELKYRCAVLYSNRFLVGIGRIFILS